MLLALLSGATGGVIGHTLAQRDDSVGLSVDPARGGAARVERPPGSVAAVAQRLLPSVVSISVEGSGGSGTGSGFVIRSDGYILTNSHVVKPAADGGRIMVNFTDSEKSERARIVGRSGRYDLAVLKVDRRGLPEMELGSSADVVVGDGVIAIGSPLGLAGTVTTGIVSAKNRPVTAGGSATGASESYINAIQTDAAINPGNSGGPLVDGDGKVIGVNSAIATLSGSFTGQGGSIGLGFAIPIEQAKRTAEQIIRDGRPTYPIIGVNLDPAYAGAGARIAARSTGSAASPVVPGGPAEAAGLRGGDVIVRVGDTPVTSADELIVAVSAHEPGEEVEIRYLREGRQRTTTVRLGSNSE